MLHRPNLSLKRLTPSNCQELLFDDVLSVERAGEEHDIFANTLREQGVEVLLLTDLLTQTLDIAEAKAWLLETQISDYRLGPTFAGDVRGWLADMPHRELARRLSGGLTYGEIPAAIKNMVVDTHTANDFIMKPLPNHLFTRDTSCWIYNGVSINPMAKPARQRETNNLRAIYRWHPAFADGDFIKYFGDENINYDHATLEGGDVLVIGRGAVLIGMSERTTPQGVEFLANSLFKHRQAQETDLLHAIEKALGINQVRLITTGGDAFEAEREQWNDANNVLTIRPGVVIGYERNVWTNEKYDKAGITVLPIPGDELGRGRGGARCMSCPLERDGI